jgi:phosphate transport system substrate-binding protein
MKRVMAAMMVGVASVGGLAGVASAADQIVKVDGSSTVYPITEAVAEEFQNSTKNAVKVTVGISGTGGGFKKFCRGETDVSDASRPILAGEMQMAKENGVEYLELPIAFDALTVVINPANTWAETMTVAELKKLWEPGAQGKVMKWSDVRAGWPDEKIELFGPGADSGTFDYFTEAVVGKSKSSRGDYTASEDDNVLVRGVEGSKNALGYFGYSYYAAHQGKMKAVKVNWEGHTKGAVGPSADTVINGTYAPLSRPLFIYVSTKAMKEKAYVKDFVSFYVKHAAEMAAEVKYVPLPSTAYEAVAARVQKMQTGTAFGGVAEAGLHIDEVVGRPLTMEPKVKPEAKPEVKGDKPADRPAEKK